jgi:hypothetical protein
MAALDLVSAIALDATSAAPPSADLVYWFTTGGAVAVLTFVVLALIRGTLVTGKTHERVLSERNRLLELALTSSAAANRAVELAHEDRDSLRRIAGTDDRRP